MKHSRMIEQMCVHIWATSSRKIEAKQMKFPEPHHKCKHIHHLFCNSKGENAQRCKIEASYQYIWCAGYAWDNQSMNYEKVLIMESPIRISGWCISSYIDTQEYKVNWREQINIQHIQESIIVTIIYITLIINASKVTKVFPKPWKYSKIISIHKSGDT